MKAKLLQLKHTPLVWRLTNVFTKMWNCGPVCKPTWVWVTRDDGNRRRSNGGFMQRLLTHELPLSRPPTETDGSLQPRPSCSRERLHVLQVLLIVLDLAAALVRSMLLLPLFWCSALFASKKLNGNFSIGTHLLPPSVPTHTAQAGEPVQTDGCE